MESTNQNVIVWPCGEKYLLLASIIPLKEDTSQVKHTEPYSCLHISDPCLVRSGLYDNNKVDGSSPFLAWRMQHP